MFDPDRFLAMTDEDQAIVCSLGKVTSFSLEQLQRDADQDALIVDACHRVFRVDFAHFANLILWYSDFARYCRRTA